jgi:hypothetical protein
LENLRTASEREKAIIGTMQRWLNSSQQASQSSIYEFFLKLKIREGGL